MAEWLRRRGLGSQGRPALSCEGVVWNYGELVADIERLSGVLAAGGVGSGDRVAYLGPNDPLFIIALFATVRLGAIFVPVNARLSEPEIAFVLRDAGVHTLIRGAEPGSLSASSKAMVTNCLGV